MADAAIENGHRNSGFTHWKWWFSIVFCMFTRGYRMMWDKSSPGDSLLPGEIPDGKPGQKYIDLTGQHGDFMECHRTLTGFVVGVYSKITTWRKMIHWLVVWNIFLFSHSVGNVIIPTDFHSIIFQRGRYTTNQPYFVAILLTRPVSWVRDLYHGETNCCHCKLSNRVTTWWFERKAGKGKRLDFTTWFYDFVSVVKQAILNSSRWIWGDSGIMMDRFFWVVHEGWGSPRKEALLMVRIWRHFWTSWLFQTTQNKTWRSGGENQILVDVDQEGLAIGEMLQDGWHFF